LRSENIIKIIGEENKENYCIIFGEKVLFAHKELDKALEAQRSYTGLYTVLYSPTFGVIPNSKFLVFIKIKLKINNNVLK
jgi:hypothetical protein